MPAAGVAGLGCMGGGVVRLWMAGAASCAMGVAFGTGAWAQTAADTPAAVAAAPQELVVTAQRREQSAQDVGIALSVLSGQDLAKRGVTNVNQLQNVSPSLEVEPAFGSGQPEFRIRGVGFQDYASNNAPTVGVYVNEVAFPIPIMTQGALFDIARVEVLRGPQGTLYGRNTTGGAVNFITNQPTQTLSAGTEIEAGSYDWVHAEAFVSGPIADGLAGRIAAFTEQGGGFQRNRVTGQGFGDADRFGLRGLLDWSPVERLRVKFEVHAAREHSDGGGLYLFQPFGTANGLGPTIPADVNHNATGWGLDPTFAKDIGAPQSSAPFRHNVQYGGSVNAAYELGAFDAVNIASYDFLNRREYEDWDASQYAESDVFFRSYAEVMSDEFRLMSKPGGPFKWIAGVYWSHQNLNEAYLSDFANELGIIASVHYKQRVDSVAAFGQGEYHLTPNLNLIFGLRYEEEKRVLDGFNSKFLFGTFPVGGLTPSTVDLTMHPVTGKAALEYKPLDSLLFYASASRGVKSGGFTAYNTGSGSGIAPFQPESLWAYETGYKATLPYRLRFNGSIFYYRYTDQQVLSAIYTPGTGAVGKFVNVDKSHIYGGELELIGEPLPHLNISQSVGYKRGTYDKFDNDLDLPASEAAMTAIYENKSGQTIPFPKLSYDGQASYWFNVAAGYKLEAEVDYSYHGYYPSWLGSTYDIPAYWLANSNLTLTPPEGRWTAAVWIHNLFDQQYDLTRNFFVNAKVAAPGRPRDGGVRLTYAF